MPLLYGEGHKAFYRLQEQIIRDSGDDSVFAWDYTKLKHHDNYVDYENVLLAPSPDFYQHCKSVQHCRPIAWNDVVDLSNNGVRFKTHYLSGWSLKNSHREGPYPSQGQAALLNCYDESFPGLRYALLLQSYSSDGSGELGYSVCPQARDGSSFQDKVWGMSAGLCTRLVLVDRSGRQSAPGRQTNVITKTLLEEQASFRLCVTLEPPDRLEFDHVLRPPCSYLDGELAPPFTDLTHQSVRTIESCAGSKWSIRCHPLSQQKMIIGVAQLREKVTNKICLLLFGYRNPAIPPTADSDGDFGVELHSIHDSDDSVLSAVDSELGVSIAWKHSNTYMSNTPRSKRSTLNIPGAGIFTAVCDLGDFEGLALNVDVTFVAEHPEIDEKVKERGISKRLSSWMTRSDWKVAVGYPD